MFAWPGVGSVLVVTLQTPLLGQSRCSFVWAVCLCEISSTYNCINEFALARGLAVWVVLFIDLFNGDGKSLAVWVIQPENASEWVDCSDRCIIF